VAASGLGVVGTVGYSTSPGVILVTRVASRYGLAMCGRHPDTGGIVSRLSALLAVIPPAVVVPPVCRHGLSGGGGHQRHDVGRALTRREGLPGGGLPVLLGTLVAAAPAGFFSALPAWLGTIVGNGLVLGILLVLLLEHVVMRPRG